MAAGSIIIDLLLKTGSFETDSKRAGRSLQQLEKEAKQMGVAIGAAFGAASIAAAHFVKSSIDAMDATSKLAQQVGITTESLSALAYAGELSGVAQDQLGSALIKLSKNMSDAATGTGEARRGFLALGIQLQNLDGTLKGSDKILVEVAEKFSKLEDGTDKTAIAVNLFGKSGAQLIPLLNAGAGGLESMGKEAEQLGLIIDSKTAKSAEAFNDNLTRMHKAMVGIANQAAAELLPSLVQVSDAFVDLSKNQELMQGVTGALRFLIDDLVISFKDLSIAAIDITNAFTIGGKAIGGYLAIVSRLAHFDLAGARAVGQAFRDDMASASEQADRLRASIRALGNTRSFDFSKFQNDPTELARRGRPVGGSGLGKINFSNTPTPKSGSAGKVSEAERYLENLRKQVERTKDLTAVEAVLDDLQSGRLKLINGVTQAQLLSLASQIDQHKNLTDQIAAEAAQYQLYMDRVNEGKRLFEDTRTPIEKLAEEQTRLNYLLQAGAIDWDTYARAVFKAQDAFDATVVVSKKTATELDNFAKNAAQSLQGTIGSGLADIMEGNFKNIGASFKTMLFRMVADAQAAQIARALFGQAAGGSGSGFWGTALSAIGTALGFGGAKAGGGDTMPNKAYLVGESGPELFVPRTAGTVVPNASGGSSRADSPSPVWQVIVQGAPSEPTVTQTPDGNGGGQLLIAFVQAARQDFLSDMAQGGKLSKAVNAVTGTQRSVRSRQGV